MIFLDIPIDELKEKLRFLAITVLHAPLEQASSRLARIPICFPHSHQGYKEKAKVSCHYHPTHLPLGQAGYPLA